jgi:CheY-like chemotaxis protein
VRLLIVDDNPVNQKLLFYSLKKYYEVATANNGLEAVILLDNENFDAVIMDLSMPIMDGAEATLRIRKSSNERSRNIPIIFLTTNDYDHERERCLNYGANDYLLKPVDVEILMKTIENNLLVNL